MNLTEVNGIPERTVNGEAVSSLTLDQSLGFSFPLMEWGSRHEAEQETQWPRLWLNSRPQESLGYSPGHNIYECHTAGYSSNKPFMLRKVGFRRGERRQRTSRVGGLPLS